ncbi:Uncharacterised protein [uncultured archaeon]|nr:Uncharacterised protein [uncultured archaeon]
MYKGGKGLNKYPLIGVSICAVVLLVLASLSNVVGYQTVQVSNQTVISNEVNQKELLFQTILDIANNKDIQRIILKSQISREGFFNPDVRLSILNTPVLTKNQLKHMYVVGLILSKTISKSKMHSIIEKYQVNNQALQKEITGVIEKDATLNREIKQLSNSKCDCGKENTALWHFPVLCSILFIINLGWCAAYAFASIGHMFDLIYKLERLYNSIAEIHTILNCLF